MAELAKGAWAVGYLVVLTVLSWLGSFAGAGYLPAPYDTITVGVVSLGVFWWAVRSGVAHVRARGRAKFKRRPTGRFDVPRSC